MAADVDPKPKRRRRHNAKVKTGCLTCKVRRVKCDETKPDCLRCQNFGCKCDGYQSRRALAPSLQVGQSKLLPIILPRVPGGVLFNDDQDYRYFRLFCEHTASSLSGYFNESLWDRIVLQASEHTPSIRHAVIAIGALDQIAHIVRSKGCPAPSDIEKQQDERSKHHQFALQRYSKAIKDMGEDLSTGRLDTRTTLIFCLLTVCFEAWNGNIQSAVMQIRNGLKLVKERLDEGSQNLSSIDDELIKVFDRLDNSSIMTLDRRLVDSSPQIRSDVAIQIRRMPKLFSLCEEARLYYELLLQSLFHEVKRSYICKLNEPIEAESKRKASILHGVESRDSFEQWHTAFLPLLRRARLSGNRKDFTAATALEMRYRASYKCLARIRDKREIGFDAAYADFQNVVDLAQTLMEHENGEGYDELQKARFSVDSSIVPSLYVVGTKCRDSTIRRRAIALLELRPRREGIWDSAISARIATLAMQMEEEGMVDGHIPECARIRGIGTTYNMVERWGRMTYLIPVDEMGERFFTKNIHFTW